MKAISDDQGHPLFDAVQPIAAAVTPERFVDRRHLLERLDELRGVFGRDYDRIAAVRPLLFGKDIASYSTGAAALFARWDEEGAGPTLPALIAHAIEFFALDPASDAVKALFMASVLGEMPNDLLYHGNEHYRKVLFHAIRLAAAHNQIFEGAQEALEAKTIITLLTASCIHDLGHEGGDNMRDGIYMPGHLEQRAFDISSPYLKKAGMDAEALAAIEVIVFCTDITPFAGDNSPCVRLKKIYKNYFWQDESEDVSTMLLGKLRRYDGRPDLVRIAMILHEADVGSSAGLSYERTIQETIDFMEERGIQTAGPRTVLGFLREQLGETMFTEAGKQIFGPAMASVIDQAEHDIVMGRVSFYN